MTRRNAVAAFASAGLVFADDFWKAKPAAEWSEKDAERLRSHSPWARSAGVEMMGGGGMGMRGGGGPGGGGRRGGAVGVPAAGAEASGGPGMGDSRPPAPEILVRWESAKPMQEAAARSETPLAATIAKVSEQFYVVSAAGVPAMAIRGGGDASALQARLKQTTVLKRKGKPDVHAEQAGILNTPRGLMFIFAFPRSEKIEDADKEVVFESTAGAVKFKTKFELKNMVYGGSLAL